ncbi:MAG: PAS domain S-box protein [Salinivirgaceae bacterium]
MSVYAYKLFLLAIKLSQIKRESLIIKTFINELNNIFRPLLIEWSNIPISKKEVTVLKLATKNKCYGYVYFKNTETLTSENVLLKKAVQLVVVIIEKTEQESQLKNQKKHLKQLVDKQTKDLLKKQLVLKTQNQEYDSINEELRQTNEELYQLNEALQNAIEESRKNENKLNEAQSLAHIGSWELDLITNTITWSDEIYRIFECRLKKDKLNYQQFLNCIHPDDREFVHEAYQRHLRTKEPYDINHRLLLPNKTVKYVNERCFSEFNEKGVPVRSIGTVTDITDKIKSEEIMYRTQYSIDNVTDSIFWIDQTSHIIYANQAACRNLEYTINELLSLSVVDIDPNFTSNKWKKHWNRITKGSYTIETTHFTKSGKQIPVEVTTNNVEFRGVHYNCAIARDITTRKRTETELINSKIKAVENEQRLLTFINSIPDIICYKDGKGNWLLANKADLELFCLTGIDYFGKNDLQLSEFTAELYKESFVRCMQSDEEAWNRKTITKGVEIIPTVYGEKKVYDVYKVPVFHSNGERKGLAVIGRDITELNNTQEILIKAKEEAEESNRLKTAFLQNMSHEIRTPMNAICGFSDLLGNPDITKEKREYYISTIQNSSFQLLSIVSDIITISSIETNQEKINLSKVNINSIILELISVFKTQSVNKKIALYSKKELNDNQAEVYTDKSKLVQILNNLLTNAFKFTNNGYIELGYKVNTTDDSSELEFYVKDSGIGIVPELHQKIFEYFRQANKSIQLNYGGTGLGLSISKGFVELLGGKIWVNSEINKGSTFYFTIPYKPVNLPISDLPVANQDKELRSILVAEDEEYNYQLIEEYLCHLGFKLIHAKNGKEAVSLCTTDQNISLVLMDIKMPEMTGDNAAKIIKKNRPDLAIIAQSGYTLESEIEKYADLFDDYITKPIKEKFLKKIVLKYMGSTLNQQKE